MAEENKGIIEAVTHNEVIVLNVPTAIGGGHLREQCHKLHDRPPCAAIVAQSVVTNSSTETFENHSSLFLVLTESDYEDYLRYRASKQIALSSTAFVVHTGNSIVCVIWFTTPGPWVLNSGAIDHLSGN